MVASGREVGTVGGLRAPRLYGRVTSAVEARLFASPEAARVLWASPARRGQP